MRHVDNSLDMDDADDADERLSEQDKNFGGEIYFMITYAHVHRFFAIAQNDRDRIISHPQMTQIIFITSSFFVIRRDVLCRMG